MVLDESRSIADVARATGVIAGTLGNWVSQERIERVELDGLTVDGRSDLAEPERLGHSTIAITLGIYSHVSPTLHDEAAQLVADLVLSSPGPRGKTT